MIRKDCVSVLCFSFLWRTWREREAFLSRLRMRLGADAQRASPSPWSEAVPLFLFPPFLS